MSEQGSLRQPHIFVAFVRHQGPGFAGVRRCRQPLSYCAKRYAPTSDPSQVRPNEGSFPGDGVAAFAGLVDRRIAGPGDNRRLLASDEP